MKIKQSFRSTAWFIPLLIIVLVSGASAAEQVVETETIDTVEGETGVYYTIQKGDTLWDLSQRFSDTPFQWPDLWNENRQITNPHQIAIALEYDADAMRAPQVTAKGVRLIAEQIKAVGRQHGVPIVENRPLAQTLYRSVDIGHEIPAILYQAVAEVLAFVYRLRQAVSSGRPYPLGQDA